MISRMIPVVLALALIVFFPADVDVAKRHKPRFKTIERTYVGEPFISLPGINVASRYPDSIDIHGPRDARIIDLDVHLYGLAHDRPSDIDILLVAPNGKTALVMSDAGGQPIEGEIDLILDDDAKQSLPRAGVIASGRYRPANYDERPLLRGGDLFAQSDPEPGGDGAPGEDGEPGEPGEPGGNPGFINDDFPPPAPEFGAATRLSTFHGMEPDGSWQLFIRSDGPASGTIADGWGLTIEVRKRR